MRSSNTVVYCAIDDLIPYTGKPLTGFPEFLDDLSEARIPCVWLTSRNRHQLDSTIRRLGHTAPFIAEGGSAVYLAEDYFHLKPARTIRLGRFTCIPVAAPQPAAAEALDLVSERTGIEVVPLRSLSPRELIQNSGLPRGEAESIRQRDFDEIFFFAGASDADILRFQHQAAHLKFAMRPHGSLWSIAVNPSIATCIRELNKLFDRALHTHAFTIGLATPSEGSEFFCVCDRSIRLTDRSAIEDAPSPRSGSLPKSIYLFDAGTWTDTLDTIQARHF